MAADFNPYHVWLSIPPEEQPPNLYRLLGMRLFETSGDVIDSAADRQMAHLRTFQGGKHGDLTQRLLNEVAAARVCLLDVKKRVEYDQQLRAKLAAAAPAPVAQPAGQPAKPPVPLRRAAAQADAEKWDDLLGDSGARTPQHSGIKSAKSLQAAAKQDVKNRQISVYIAAAVVLIVAAGNRVLQGRPAGGSTARRAWQKLGMLGQLGVVGVAVATIALICALFVNNELAKDRAAANQGLEQAVAAARAWIKEGRLDDAAKIEEHLKDRMAEPDATDINSAQAILTALDAKKREREQAAASQSAKQQAQEVWEAAMTAFEKKQIDNGIALLKKYLADAHGTEQARAQSLLKEAESGTSDAAAKKTLAAMSDQELAVFRATDRFVAAPLSMLALSEVRLATLKRNLADEVFRRAKTQQDIATQQAKNAAGASDKSITNSIGMKLVLIPAGEFLMGSPETETGRFRGSNDEHQHRVRITKPFYMGVYAVTQREYERIMGSNPSYFAASGGGKDKVSGLDTSRFPVEQVSWDAAQEFCRRLSQKEGKRYRLPTEAEWEYACRAGTTTAFNFGDSLNGDNANCDGTQPYGTEVRGRRLGRSTTVGSYAPNAWGLYDMHGNVFQRCQDWYGESYFSNSPTDDPPGPSVGSFRVIRGGSWDYAAVDCRSASRVHFGPAYRNSYRFGFRLVCEPSPTPSPNLSPSPEQPAPHGFLPQRTNVP
jgi:formylglycine-generating enzyme required for sulfatase activity